MPGGVLTLEAGSRFWFEGEVWEVDTFLRGPGAAASRRERPLLSSTHHQPHRQHQ